MTEATFASCLATAAGSGHVPRARGRERSSSTSWKGCQREVVLVVDLAGLDVLSGSFADEALAETVARLAAGALPGRYLLVRSPSDELLEDLESKLKGRRLAAARPGGKDLARPRAPAAAPLPGAGMVDRSRRGDEPGAVRRPWGSPWPARPSGSTELARLRLVHRVQRPRSMGGIEHWATSLVSLKKAP